MDFGLIGEECACICGQMDFVPRFKAKRKKDIRYFSSKQKVVKLLLSLFAASKPAVVGRLPLITYHRALAVTVAGSKTKPPLFCVIDDNE